MLASLSDAAAAIATGNTTAVQSAVPALVEQGYNKDTDRALHNTIVYLQQQQQQSATTMSADIYIKLLQCLVPLVLPHIEVLPYTTVAAADALSEVLVQQLTSPQGDATSNPVELLQSLKAAKRPSTPTDSDRYVVMVGVRSAEVFLTLHNQQQQPQQQSTNNNNNTNYLKKAEEELNAIGSPARSLRCEDPSLWRRYLSASASVAEYCGRYSEAMRHLFDWATSYSNNPNNNNNINTITAPDINSTTHYIQLTEAPLHMYDGYLRCVYDTLLANQSLLRDRIVVWLARDGNTRRLLPSALVAVVEQLAAARMLRGTSRRVLEQYALPRYLSKNINVNNNTNNNNIVFSLRGQSPLQAAIIVHNLVALSHYYENISLPDMARVLGLPVATAERMTGRLLRTGRLQGHIDQEENVVWFANSSSSTGGDGGEKNNMNNNNTNSNHNTSTAQITAICDRTEEVYELVLRQHPQMATAVQQ